MKYINKNSYGTTIIKVEENKYYFLYIEDRKQNSDLKFRCTDFVMENYKPLSENEYYNYLLKQL